MSYAHDSRFLSSGDTQFIFLQYKDHKKIKASNDGITVTKSTFTIRLLELVNLDESNCKIW